MSERERCEIGQCGEKEEEGGAKNNSGQTKQFCRQHVFCASLTLCMTASICYGWKVEMAAEGSSRNDLTFQFKETLPICAYQPVRLTTYTCMLTHTNTGLSRRDEVC